MSSGSFTDPGGWWWELRPHPRFGTLELRVADAQTTVFEAAGVAAFAQCLVAALADRCDSGVRLAVAPTWRIEENRWRAARDGVEGRLADLVTGERRATRSRLRALLTELVPVAGQLGCEASWLRHSGSSKKTELCGSAPSVRARAYSRSFRGWPSAGSWGRNLHRQRATPPARWARADL